MIAKAYFYQREYVKSIEAFRFISRQFEGTKKDYQAKLWLIRCYINNNDLSSADLILNQLLSDDDFPIELNKSCITLDFPMSFPPLISISSLEIDFF